ncbi:integrase catalytic domain-containing protein, partial [Haematococcus lacustris]
MQTAAAICHEPEAAKRVECGCTTSGNTGLTRGAALLSLMSMPAPAPSAKPMCDTRGKRGCGAGKAQKRLSRSERGLWLLRDRVWVPRSPLVKQAVLEKCHDDAFAGHVGITKTKKLVSRHFYWPGWDKDVEDYVRH